MNHHEPQNPAGTAVKSGRQWGEDELARMREDLREAIRCQERLQVELRAAVKELSETITHRPRSTDVSAVELQRIEARLRGVEQRLNGTSEQLQGILQSRIWRTLVNVGGIFMRFRWPAR